MASTFNTGTINQPDAGSVGLAMAEKIRDELVAHAAYDLVEEFLPASGLVRWYVFKALAAQTGLPSDYFIIMGRTLGNGELRFMICEDYVTGTHTANYYSQAHQYSSQFLYDASGRYGGAPYILGQQQLNQSVAAPYNSWVPSGTSTKWWMVVHPDTWTVAFNGASNGFVHCGLYTPLTQMAITMPVQMVGYAGNVQGGHICRNPAVANATNFGGATACVGGGAGGAPTTNLLGFASRLDYNDKLQNNQRPVAEIGMTVLPYQMSYITSIGYILGKQRNVRVGASGSAPQGFAFGDAYAMSGRLWVPYEPVDTRVWDTGVAAT